MTTEKPLVNAYDRCAEDYASGRPSYPADAVGEILRYTRGGRVLEVAAGTGALTRLLLARGVDLVATDLSAEMLGLVGADVPLAVAEVAGLPFADARFTSVVAATAFHWFATEPAIAELHRVLAPAGRLVLTWNDGDEREPIVREHQRLVGRWTGTAPTFRSMEWRRALEESGRFRLLGEHSCTNPTWMTHEVFCARIRSTSFVAALSEERRKAIVADARELVRSLPEPFAYPYVTRTFAFEVRGSRAPSRAAGRGACPSR